MQTQNLLKSVLEAYRDVTNLQDINDILSKTVLLLTTLKTPQNVTLLTSQLLTAPAIWSHVNGVVTSFRMISIFNTAATTIKKNELGRKTTLPDRPISTQSLGIGRDDWTRAVLQGLDDKSFRWQHVLVMAGILLGMERQEGPGLSRSSRINLQRAMVDSTNQALQETASSGFVAACSIVLALVHAFPVLSKTIQRRLKYDELLPIMIRAMNSSEGFQNGVFMENINLDLREENGTKIHWSDRSTSFLKLQNLCSRPLIVSMGQLSRLIAYAIEHCSSPLKVVETRCNLVSFSSSILERWRKTKLSEIDPAEESNLLTSATLQVTAPLLWQLLKTAMFATIVVLRAIIAKTLINHTLSSEQFAPATASQVLLILKNINFISSRQGSNVFSAYTFVKLGSIDILTSHPYAAVAFLRSVYPSSAGTIPSHSLERNHELFYLNMVEHFTFCLGPANAESLIVEACLPYLSIKDAQLSEIFEAAHSAMLSVFATPQNAELTVRYIPLYVENLFASFPRSFSPRQFRYAFKTLVQICSPPNPLSTSQPMLTEILLEALHQRALNAPIMALATEASVNKNEAESLGQEILLSEQAVFVLALLDALPNVTLSLLRTWLPFAAKLLNRIPDKAMRQHCQERFWEILESGEMDIERSAICVTWWTTQGGRESVLSGDENLGQFKVIRESRL
ncbi:hypothetical protein K3495_g470 [Podosphaera aphanis]|nr:hypothetical protein K3495_g470 [Podosphaera aphanis]